MGVRSRASDARTWIGRRATDPRVAGAAVGATAVPFTTAWLVLFDAPYAVPAELSAAGLVLGVICVSNAVLVTAGVWSLRDRLSPGPLTTWSGARLGLFAGVASYPGVALLLLGLALVSALADPTALAVADPIGALAWGAVGVVAFVVLVAVMAAIATLGIPVVLSVLVGALLGWCRARERGGDRQPATDRRDREPDGPPITRDQGGDPDSRRSTLGPV